MSDSPDPALERSLYYGILFQVLLWGLLVYMYAGSVYYFMTNSRIRAQKRACANYCVAGGLILFFSTVEVFSNAVLMQFTWIEQRDFPGGPLGYFAVGSTTWWAILGTAADMFANFVGDGLLLYRCWVVWDASWKLMLGMLILYLASVAMAIVSLVQSALPGAQFFSGETVNFGVPWTVLTVALNVCLTTLITFRILRARAFLKDMGNHETAAVYTGVVAILVESALPFTAIGIIYAVLYGMELNEAPFFSFLWGTLVGLCPQMIIYRVAAGASLTQRTNVASFRSTTSGSTTMIFTRDVKTELPTHVVSHGSGTAALSQISSGTYASKKSLGPCDSIELHPMPTTLYHS